MSRLNAESEARELLTAEPVNNGFQTILTTSTATRTNANHTERQCHIVAGNKQIFRLAFAILIQQRAHCIAAQVHKGLRLDEQHSLTRKSNLSDFSACFVTK